MKIKRKHIAVGGACSPSAQPASEPPSRRVEARTRRSRWSGPAADRAREAALAAHPGTANAVERDSEKGATWEVEITGTDGKTVDVRLDENYKVMAVEGDGGEQGENEDEGGGE